MAEAASSYSLACPDRALTCETSILCCRDLAEITPPLIAAKLLLTLLELVTCGARAGTARTQGSLDLAYGSREPQAPDSCNARLLQGGHQAKHSR